MDQQPKNAQASFPLMVIVVEALFAATDFVSGAEQSGGPAKLVLCHGRPRKSAR